MILLLAVVVILGSCTSKDKHLTPEAAREELSRRGLDYNAKSFVAIAKTGGPDVIRTFLDAGMDVDALDDSGETALLQAARSGNCATLRILLTAGANVSLVDRDGLTALHRAARSTVGYDCVRALLEYGADPDAKTPRGNTALMEAIYLPELDRPVELLFLSNQFDTLKTLLDHGANVNSKNQDGLTPLMRAAAFGNVRVVQVLIDRGADVKATDNRGRTARMCALEYGSDEVAKAIEQAGS